MSFNAIAQDVASTLTGVFGDLFTFERENVHRSQITAIIRRDVETVDESGQVVMVDHVARIARQDVPFLPKRGDTLCDGTTTYTLGQRIQDDNYHLEYEVTT